MSAALPAGWSAHQDPEGRTFYANAATGETSWTLPEPAGSALPEGWAAYQDGEGRTFYANSATGETSWERPAGGSAAPAAAPEPAVPAVGSTLYAIQFIQQILAMPDLLSAVGDERVQRLGMRAQGVLDAYSQSDPKKVGAAVRDLTKVCLRLRAFNVSPLVAEMIAAAVASVAGLMEPGFMPGGVSMPPAEVLGVLTAIAKDLDQFQPHLNGGLSRADAATSKGYANASTQRIYVALSGVCAWLITAVCRAVGYRKITSKFLWEWTNSDPLWMAVLAKGALTFDQIVRSVPDTPMNGPLFPPDLSEVQNTLMGAILLMHSSNIAFSDVTAAQSKDDEVDEVTSPNVKFTKHWAKLAMAVAENDLLGPLLTVAEGPAAARKAELAEFLAKILQPALLQDPDWMSKFSQGPIVVEAARGAASNVRETLARHASSLWALFATVPASGSIPRSFLKDCSEVAFRSPVAAPECMSLVRGCLTGHGLLETAGTDPAALTALVVLVGNAGVGPGMDDGGLAESLRVLQPEARMAVAARLAEWPGPAARTAQACWSAYMQGAAPPGFAAEPQATAVALTPGHLQALGIGGLRKILSKAPPELCCSLDRQLLTDPVRSPYGHAYEYNVLAWTLNQNGAVCPFTGQPLTLESCQRDAELQQQAASWIQGQYS